MNNSTPLISVLMPLYNTEKYLAEAIESILNQTYADFEFLIIDDASTDGSLQILENYKDPRIQLIKKPVNTGYTNSLNMGLQLAKGKYIARMDSDDISLPTRFEKQVNLLESDAGIGVCGSWFKIIGSETVISHPSTHDEIKVALLTYCALGHPTIMMRKSVLDQHNIQYDTTFEPAEDYHLWAILGMVTRLANISEVLLNYRVHATQVSSKRAEKQIFISNEIRLLQLANIGVVTNESQRKLHINLIYNNGEYLARCTENEVIAWLDYLCVCNGFSEYFPSPVFLKMIRNFWINYLQAKSNYSYTILIKDFYKPYSIKFLSKITYLKFIGKCFLHYNNK